MLYQELRLVYCIVLFFLLVFIISIIGVRPCLATSSLHSESRLKRDHALIFCGTVYPSGFDPSQRRSMATYQTTSKWIYDRLVRVDSSGTTIPSLASGWKISADGRIYTFYLRQNVSFHTTPWFTPTRNFNADDVLFTFIRGIFPEKSLFAQKYRVSTPYFESFGLKRDIQEIRKIDDYTIQFILKRKNASFLMTLSEEFTSILSREYANTLLDHNESKSINFKPVGTGPFILNHWLEDSYISYKKNKDYWGSRIRNSIDVLLYRVMRNNQIRVSGLKRAECDVVTDLTPTAIAEVKVYKKAHLYKGYGANIGYIAYNNNRKYLNKTSVRYALNMAIDKELIIKDVYKDNGYVAHQLLPKNQWGYNKNFYPLTFNVSRARQILKKSHIPKDFSITLLMPSVARPYDPNPRLIGEIIQNNWSKLGITVKIMRVGWAEYLDRVHSGRYDVTFSGWTPLYGDPDEWYGVLLTCHTVTSRNITNWCSGRYDDLIKQAKETRDKDKRILLYQKAWNIENKDMPIFPVVHAYVIFGLSKRVKNFSVDRFGLAGFSYSK